VQIEKAGSQLMHLLDFFLQEILHSRLVCSQLNELGFTLISGLTLIAKYASYFGDTVCTHSRGLYVVISSLLGLCNSRCSSTH
jgi:hypothetical protein